MKKKRMRPTREGRRQLKRDTATKRQNTLLSQSPHSITELIPPLSSKKKKEAFSYSALFYSVYLFSLKSPQSGGALQVSEAGGPAY